MSESGVEVYLDHAATTPLRPGVLEAMLPFFHERYANPSAAYASGRATRASLDMARDTMADRLGIKPSELYFTSGGTEAINIALKGYAHTHRNQGRHLLVSAVEHHAVLHAAEALKADGFTIDILPVDVYGRVILGELEQRITASTLMVAVMHANNEVGTIQPIHDISQICKQKGVALHVDAVQTAGHLASDAWEDAAFISISAHKFGGPKGVGALIARRGWVFEPLLHGGGQERERRAGTENVAGIVGMATALELSYTAMPEENERLARLGSTLKSGVQETIGDAVFSGHPDERLPGFVHTCIPGVKGESLIHNLDQVGVAVASGSACSTGSTLISHVLLAMGVPTALAAGALRFTLGHTSNEWDIDQVLAKLPPIVERLRRIGSV